MYMCQLSFSIKEGQATTCSTYLSTQQLKLYTTLQKLL